MDENCLNYHDVIDRLCVWMSYQKVSKKDVRDHLPDIRPFRWVIAAVLIKLFERG